MRLAVTALTLSLVFALHDRAVAAPVDGALVGTWQARGTVMTSSMQRSGGFLLRIERDGTYLLVSTGSTEFVIDSGRYVEARGGGYLRRTTTGLEDRGRYARSGDGIRFRSLYGELAATRAAAGTGEPTLTRLATLLRIPPRNHISHWTARAAHYASIWQRDARLDYVSMLDFDANGLLGPTSTATIAFYSPGRDQFLLLSPMRGSAGAMAMSVVPRSGRTVSARGIPLPIVDFAMLLKREAAAGRPRIYRTADLRFFSEGGSAPRLMWLARPANSDGFARTCLDVATVSLIDCRKSAGDPLKDFQELERRAAAAWAAMQQRLGAGDTSSGDLSYVPPSDFERCSGRGGSHNGVGCFDSTGSEIRVY